MKIVIPLNATSSALPKLFERRCWERENVGNFARHLTDENCEFTELTSAFNTLTITKWGTPGQIGEGTVTGTLYENSKTVWDCSNSTGKSFSFKFKLKQLQ